MTAAVSGAGAAFLTLARFGLSLVLASTAASVAWRRGALTRGGALAGAVFGTLLFTLGGVGWSLPLLAFLVPAAWLSGRGKGRAGPRNGRQVWANGGASLLALLLLGEASAAGAARAALAGLAGAAADTWATEVGRLTGAVPRHLASGRPVPPGTSGAVSLPGTLGALAGGGCVALAGLALLALPAGWGPAWLGVLWSPMLHQGAGLQAARQALVVWGAGFAGMMVDSVLGATLQERRRCRRCGLAAEEARCPCGGETRRVGGLAGFDNDTVNFLATLAAAALGFAAGSP